MVRVCRLGIAEEKSEDVDMEPAAQAEKEADEQEEGDTQSGKALNTAKNKGN